MSNDYIFIGFMQNLKKEKNSDEKKISITPVNFGNLKAEVFGDGVISLSKLASLYEWSKSVLKQKAHQLDFFTRFHSSSPKFWLKTIDNPYCNDEEKKVSLYCVGLDLEIFMESKKKKQQEDVIEQTDSFIPDNYELAKKVMKKFRKDPLNKKFKLQDVSYRETAMWESEDKAAVLALGNFIQASYVEPMLKELSEENGIVDFVFTEKQLDFVYGDK